MPSETSTANDTINRNFRDGLLNIVGVPNITANLRGVSIRANDDSHGSAYILLNGDPTMALAVGKELLFAAQWLIGDATEAQAAFDARCRDAVMGKLSAAVTDAVATQGVPA